MAGSELCPEHALIRRTGMEYGHVLAGRLGVQVGFETYNLGPPAVRWRGARPRKRRSRRRLPGQA